MSVISKYTQPAKPEESQPEDYFGFEDMEYPVDILQLGLGHEDLVRINKGLEAYSNLLGSYTDTPLSVETAEAVIIGIESLDPMFVEDSLVPGIELFKDPQFAAKATTISVENVGQMLVKSAKAAWNLLVEMFRRIVKWITTTLNGTRQIHKILDTMAKSRISFSNDTKVLTNQASILGVRTIDELKAMYINIGETTSQYHDLIKDIDSVICIKPEEDHAGYRSVLNKILDKYTGVFKGPYRILHNQEVVSNKGDLETTKFTTQVGVVGPAPNGSVFFALGSPAKLKETLRVITDVLHQFTYGEIPSVFSIKTVDNLVKLGHRMTDAIPGDVVLATTVYRNQVQAYSEFYSSARRTMVHTAKLLTQLLPSVVDGKTAEKIAKDDKSGLVNDSMKRAYMSSLSSMGLPISTAIIDSMAGNTGYFEVGLKQYRTMVEGGRLPEGKIVYGTDSSNRLVILIPIKDADGVNRPLFVFQRYSDNMDVIAYQLGRQLYGVLKSISTSLVTIDVGTLTIKDLGDLTSEIALLQF